MADRASGESRRQVVSFTFYRLLPEWRRLPQEEKNEQRRQFASMIARWQAGNEMSVLTYSLVGMRADADLMLWRICYSLECLQQMQADLLKTELGAHLTVSHSFLSMTRRSQYRIGHESERPGHTLIRCGNHKYAQIHPFVKTRAWYQLPFEERQRIVSEYIHICQDYPQVRLNATYSFGLDDQEYILALEADDPADLVDLVMRLRESENSAYTLRDTPVFTCVRCTADEMLARLG